MMLIEAGAIALLFVTSTGAITVTNETHTSAPTINSTSLDPIDATEGCGGDWEFPCDSGCDNTTIWYTPANVCLPCGGEGDFCCGPESAEWECEGVLTCEVQSNPYDTIGSDVPYGLARICTAATIDQGGTQTSSSCPGEYGQCAGSSFSGRANCCQSGLTCEYENQYFSQCRKTQKSASGSSSSPSPPSGSKSGGGSGEPRRVSKKNGLVEWRSSKSPKVPGAKEWKYEIDTMLGMSFAFYEIQRAGPLPPDSRIPWRADSLKQKGGGNLDGEFQGGYFDAGDHLKFQLPGAYSVARLAWLTWKYKSGLQKTYFDGESNYKWALEATKWGADFMVKSVKSNKLLLHVGDIQADHAYIGRAEDYPQVKRDVYWCKPGACSDVAGEVAAALAHAAVAFKGNKKLRGRYWSKAKQAYKQTGVGKLKFGNSNDVFTDLAIYYKSSGIVSHVLFAAASMYSACRAINCGDAGTYLKDVNKLGNMKEADGGIKWFWEVPGWDNAWWDAAVLMAGEGEAGPPIYGKPAFTTFLGAFADKWVNGVAPVEISPLGQRWVSAWGSNRWALGGASILLMWADLPSKMRAGKVSAQSARCAAVKQIHYVAGDSDRGSFVAGWGDGPGRNHHRNSACAPWEQRDLGGSCFRVFEDVANPMDECSTFEDKSKGICFKSANRPNRFQTHGALVGGPKTPTDAGSTKRKPFSDEGWNDWRTDWIGSEQALDYNAGFTVALAAATELPKSFWTTKCSGKKLDLDIGKRTGTSRKAKKYKSGDVWTWDDFKQYGWTRSFPNDWMDRIP